MLKLLSAWYQGNPFSTPPLPAVRASSSSPSEPATRSVPPWRSPTAIEASTPLWAAEVSVGGLVSWVNHWSPPLGLMAW